MTTTQTSTKVVQMPDGETVKVSEAPGSKNWRTLAFNGGTAIALAALTFLAGVDWTQYVSPNMAMFLVLAVNFGLRFLSSGPAMSNVQVKQVS